MGQHIHGKVQTEMEEIPWHEGSTFLVIDNLNWIEVEFFRGQFRITPYLDTEVVVDEPVED